MSNPVAIDGKTLGPDQKTMARRIAAYLAERAIPQKWAVQIGIDLELAEELRDGTAVEGAIAFRYWNADGTPRDFIRYRLFGADHKFHQPAGTGVHLYMPPLQHAKLSMPDVLADPNQPLIIAEGETRAAALNYRGMPAVAIGGIDMYGKDGRLCDDLLRIPMQKRQTLLVVDHDIARHKHKQRSLARFTRLLVEQGADVRWLPMPDLGDGVTGADDFIAQRGVRAFKKLVADDAKAWNHPDFASWGDEGIALNLRFEPMPVEWLTDEPPGVEWLWQDLLPRNKVALLIGEGNVGKTYFGLRLAQAVASGRPLLGRPTRRGRAVVISCEEDETELRRRMYAIHEREINDFKPMPKAEVAKLRKALTQNVVTVSAVGQELYLVTMRDFGTAQGRALDVLIHQLRQLGQVDLVVIDPISRVHNLVEENQAWGTAMINAAERIAREVGCTIVLAHHTGKQKEQKNRTDAYSARGASALPDAARVVLKLQQATVAECKDIENVSEADAARGSVLRLIHAKASGGPKQPPMWLRRYDDGVLSHFTPRYADTQTNVDAMLTQLRDWQKRGNATLYKETIRKQYRAIFHDSLSRQAAVALFERAVTEGRLIASASAKNPRGRGYVFAEEHA